MLLHYYVLSDIHPFQKQPFARKVVGVNFRPVFGDLPITVVTISDIDLATESSANITSSGGVKDNIVSVIFDGGLNNHRYKATVRAIATDGSVVKKEEKDIFMDVIDE